MGKHLTLAEQEYVSSLIKRDRKPPMEAFKALVKQREDHGESAPNKSTFYRYLNGQTHAPLKQETRGRHKLLRKADVRKLQQSRRRLAKAADSEKRITYEDILEEAGLDSDPSLKTAANAMREQGIKFRPPRRKIALTKKDANKRKRVALDWKKKRKSFWSTKVHGYRDEKAFAMPLALEQRKRYKQQRCTGHLRLASEGAEQGFTKPRDKHSFLGFPSVVISAAVAADSVILWHENKKWNGDAAAALYKGPLKTALKRKWGERARYTIIEDGDRKGNQSTKGLAAKVEVGIDAMVLPPRTSAFPYCLFESCLIITAATVMLHFMRIFKHVFKHFSNHP